MLYAIVFKLVAQDDGILPGNNGYLVHAAFLNMIRQVDPALSGHFHDANERKPYTVSPVLGHGNLPYDTIRLGRGQEVWIRVSLLDARLFSVLTAHLLARKPVPCLRLQGIELTVAEILVTPYSHPRAGYTTVNDLMQHWNNQDPLPDTVKLHFLTPTAISNGKGLNGRKRFLLFPDPVRLWNNIRRQWGLAGGDDPGKSYDAWVEESVSVIAFDLKTHLLHFSDYDQVGYEGWATFRAASPNRDALVLWRTLADFAFYSGVGYKTPMGMGQIEVRDG